MTHAEFDALALSFDGVRRTHAAGRIRWQYQGRLIAREVDGTAVAIRSSFDARTTLLQRFPSVFSVPKRFVNHMIVVGDLQAGGHEAFEAALTAAWHLQVSGG